MASGFVFPYKAMLGPSGFSRSTEVEAWLPLEFVAADSRQTGVVSLTRSTRYLSVVGRLRPGVTAAQANAEIAGIAQRLAAAYPASNRAVGGTVVPLHEQAVGGVLGQRQLPGRRRHQHVTMTRRDRNAALRIQRER